jgi:hypothetical protein
MGLDEQRLLKRRPVKTSPIAHLGTPGTWLRKQNGAK